jgi:hypothetical protein
MICAAGEGLPLRDPASMSDDKEHNCQHNDEEQHRVNGDAQYHGKDRDEQGDDNVKNHETSRNLLALIENDQSTGCLPTWSTPVQIE